MRALRWRSVGPALPHETFQERSEPRTSAKTVAIYGCLRVSGAGVRSACDSGSAWPRETPPENSSFCEGFRMSVKLLVEGMGGADVGK